MSENYTIISGTNRPGSNTIKIAGHYRNLLEAKGIIAAFMSLEGWQYLHRNPEYEQLEKTILVPTHKFIFISPEYNGSIPGVLKLMFDISDYKKAWKGKKALLTGVATGRSGNLRGMEHLTSILHYLGVVVHPNKLPISAVDKLLLPDGKLHDNGTMEAINNQLDEFIQF
jgi:chromate reductase, NAD(P)H dehydrogenase (quinone)